MGINEKFLHVYHGNQMPEYENQLESQEKFPVYRYLWVAYNLDMISAHRQRRRRWRWK